jgi:uncharacterized iron-regulated membrane protein
MKRLLILIHRYLGIPLSVAFVVWFVSGIVMIYSGGLPAIPRDEQLARLEPIDLARVLLTPLAAWSRAGMSGVPSGVTLRTVLGRPAWQFDLPFAGKLAVFADNGTALGEVTPEQAAAVASEYLDVPAAQLRFERTLFDPDQWTLGQRGDLPLHLFSVADTKATRVYVSVDSGEVSLVTNRSSRFVAWIGVIPHWLYFAPLRLNQPLWYRTVVALSALGCVLAAIGLILAVTQFRRSRPFTLEKSVRYQGWMRWHYISGAIFGVFALTWVFSGLMSMEPFAWTNATGLEVSGNALTGGPLDVESFPDIRSGSAAGRQLDALRAGEIEYLQILGEPFFAVTTERRELINANTLERASQFDTDAVVNALNDAAGEAVVVSAELLHEYDAYYYARNGAAALPVLRVRFDDPMQTWYYIDPAEAQIVSRVHRYSRIERWLFNGLHSLDFAFWYDRRPVWDIGMIALSLGALLTSSIGMFLGFRRLSSTRLRNDATP